MKQTWIKVRDHLGEDPKVLRIAKLISKSADATFLSARQGNSDLLGDRLVTLSVTVTRDVTIASLLRLWSNIASNGRYEVLPPESNTTDNISIVGDLDTIDAITGVPGFGKAMQSVGWLIFDRERELLYFPNFLEYNTLRHGMTAGKSKAAAKMAAWRAAQKQKKEPGNVTSPVTGNKEVTSEVTPPVTNSQIEREIENLSPPHHTPGARPTLPEAIAYAKVQTASDVTGNPITPEIVTAWMDARLKVGWRTPVGDSLQDIEDWRADLRSYARQWKKLEGKFARPGGSQAPRHQALQRDVTAGMTAKEISTL